MKKPRGRPPAGAGPDVAGLVAGDLLVELTTPDAPYWLRYRLTAGPTRALHTAEVTLSPTDDGSTDLHWRATPTRRLPGTTRRSTAALEAAVAQLAERLASAAEDPATTRVDHVRENLSAASGPMPDPAMRERISMAMSTARGE